ncbi:MAG: restriction endonuclease [Phycisphaerales bacterium]
MSPLLELASDGRERTIGEAIEELARRMSISEQDQELLLPSGTQTRLYNRVTWALTYLTQAKLLEKPTRGRFRISKRGREVLAAGAAPIDNRFLEQFAEFQEFRSKKKPQGAKTTSDASVNAEEDEQTPKERLETAFTEMRQSLALEILERVQSGSPKFFEHLVVGMLVAMGYGGGRRDWARVTGKSGDDGIDGVIREDRLGLDMVYVQAKKWDGAVGPGEIDRFVGSLMRKKASKGVFLTSSRFTDGAERAAREASVTVRLIDGEELANLMIDFGVGVSESARYVIKQIDTDFFEESGL